MRVFLAIWIVFSIVLGIILLASLGTIFTISTINSWSDAAQVAFGFGTMVLAMVAAFPLAIAVDSEIRR